MTPHTMHSAQVKFAEMTAMTAASIDPGPGIHDPSASSGASSLSADRGHVAHYIS